MDGILQLLMVPFFLLGIFVPLVAIIPAIVFSGTKKYKLASFFIGATITPIISYWYIIIFSNLTGESVDEEYIFLETIAYNFVFAIILSFSSLLLTSFLIKRSFGKVSIVVVATILCFVGFGYAENAYQKAERKQVKQGKKDNKKTRDEMYKIAVPYMKEKFDVDIVKPTYNEKKGILTVHFKDYGTTSAYMLFIQIKNKQVVDYTLKTGEKEFKPTMEDFTFIKREISDIKNINERSQFYEKNKQALITKYGEKGNSLTWTPVKLELKEKGIKPYNEQSNFIINDSLIETENTWHKYRSIFAAQTSFENPSETKETFQKMIQIIDSLGINTFDFYILYDANGLYQPIYVCNVDNDIEKDRFFKKELIFFSIKEETSIHPCQYTTMMN